MSLSTLIKSIQDIMRKDAGVDGDAQRISQLAWMIFLKLFDDKDQELELIEDDYISPIPEPLQWRTWAADGEGITGDSLLDFVDNTLFPELSALDVDADNLRGLIVREVFSSSFNYMKSGTLLRQVINKLNTIDFTASDSHRFNDIYEKILKDLQNAGNAGEYYTPRAVTRFMTEMVNPKLGEIVLDPACGTGGFLVDTIEHLRRGGVNSLEERKQLQHTIRGIEKKPLPHTLAITNLILHDVEAPLVEHKNTLSRALKDYGKADRVDVILTNPPFGGMEEDGIENNFPSGFRTRETADLFLVLIMRLLKKGGRAALVLPDGFLFGEGTKTRIKEKLTKECNLHTIVRLPKGVFAPYTTINTNLLFFNKGEPTKEVWFYEHPYPPGYKSYSKTKPIRISEFDAEKAWWDKREENEYAWRISIEDLKARGYNLDVKNPHIEEVETLAPQTLLANYQSLQAKVSAVQDELKAELAKALGRA